MSEEKQEKPSITFSQGYRGTYINVLEARAFARKGQAKGDPKYSATVIVTPAYVDRNGKQVIDPASDLGKLMQMVTDTLKAVYPGKKLVVGRRMTQEELDVGAVEVNVPWFKGEKEIARMKEKQGAKFDEVAAKKLYAGTVCVKASSKYQPALDVIDKAAPGGVVTLTTPEAIKAIGTKHFYSGAFFLPTFALNPYKGDEKNNGGVSLYLNALLFVKHGERIGGRVHNAAEAYKGYLGKISQEDPTEGMASEDMDDEIPF